MQNVCSSHQLVSERLCPLGIITGDKANDVRAGRHAPRATKSACKPCGELSLHFFMRDALAAVELIHPFLDCRKKFDLLCDFLQGNFIGQFANGVQDNFFLAHANEYVPPSKPRQTGSGEKQLMKCHSCPFVVNKPGLIAGKGTALQGAQLGNLLCCARPAGKSQ